MSSIFVISDLHITKNGMTILNPDNYDKTYTFLTENINSDDLLIICGDLMDKGGTINNRSVEKNVKSVLNFLGELNCKVLFVPGNHDISDDLIKATEKTYDDNNKYNRINKLLEYFRNNHPNILIPTTISVDKTIVSHIRIGNTLIVGLNSTCRIGVKHESGYIDTKSLEKELDALKNGIEDFDSLYKIAVVHHNDILYEKKPNYNRNTSNGNLKNAKNVKKSLSDLNFDSVITGHAHGLQSKKDFDYLHKNLLKNHFTVGPLERVDKEFTDNISISQFVLSEKGFIRSQIIHAFVTIGSISSWNSLDPISINESEESPFSSPLDVEEERTDNTEALSSDANNYLLGRIRDNGLLKTGHFCNDTIQSLTWLDTSPFIDDRYRLERICTFFKSIYKDELKKQDVIIGLGMKGTIISNSLRAHYLDKNILYHSDDFDSSENTVPSDFFINSINNSTNILIVSDVFCSGKTISKFLNSLNISYQNKTISILCIFHKTSGEIKDKVFISEKKIDIKGKETSVDVYALCCIPNIICPISQSRNQCEIYNKKLCEINEI